MSAITSPGGCHGNERQIDRGSVIARKSRRLSPDARADDTYMAGKQWSALRCGARRSNGLICRGRALENGRCKWHGGKSTPYHTRPIPPASIERIRLASRARLLARWQAWRDGGCIPQDRPNKRRTAISRATWMWTETDEQRRARIIADLQVRFPDRNWDD